MTRLAVDTNVWRDLEAGSLLEDAIRLGHELLVPDILIAEEITRPILEQIQGGITETSLDAGELSAVGDVRSSYDKISHADAVLLVSAEVHNAILVSGDQPLREAARDRDLRVHGQLWFVEQMIEDHIIRQNEAALALQMMLDAGRWLPPKATKDRIKKWSAG
jgi:predicted nucleic acid-binding protein